MKPRARWSHWLAPICVGASLIALTVTACSVPEFEFPTPPAPGAAGDGSIPNATDPCQNKQIDTDTGETDFDCGGACAPCGAGKHCVDAPDCEAELLCHEGTCIGLGCMNEAQDGAETDVDCGGGTCKACITGQACAAATDCEGGVCGDAKCLAPACDDQVRNGKETGLDCGGDCSPCPVDQPCVVAKDCISNECNDAVCGAECQDGFANCDKVNDNACEINTRTDLSNCGFCGNVCKLANATAECSAGECRIKTDGCEVGFQDCNGDPADGCEVDLKTNKLNCGACNKVCPSLNGDPSCSAGLCQITCNDGFEDCDDSRDNGCEINVKTSSKNCNACDKKCSAALGYSAFCKDGACGQTMCPAGKGDCNGDQSDACEINLTNDVDNCGDCGHVCSANNANVACVNSQCVITSCLGKFADCDKATVDGFKTGCEVDTDVNTGNCGGCGKACNLANSTPQCAKGACEVNCTGTFRDCDSDPKTGCEINIATNTKNCGGCGNLGSDCSTKYANANSTCAASACSAPTCDAGFGDCKGGLTDGCESDTTSDSLHCGDCAIACATAGAHVSTNDCVSSQCDPKCSTTYLSCDNNKPNGCEANSDDEEANCGACGTICSSGNSAHVTSNDCGGGTCHPVCSGTWGDCDSSRTNGCEVDTASSSSNCGGCGATFTCSTAAAAHVTSNGCSGSACHPMCSPLFDDCDTSRTNGGEKDVSADASNCGACGTVCGTTNASGTGCGSGKCTPSCSPGWGKCTTPEKGCVTPLGTTSNCTKCGEACSGLTPFCDPTGCVDHRDIVVVNKGTQNVNGWDGGANVLGEIKLDHNLQTGKLNNRMLVVGIACSDNFTNPENVSVTYAGTPMLVAFEQEDGGKHSYAGIYYLLDSALPDNPSTNQVIASFGPAFSWGHAGVDVVELKNTMQVGPIATGGAAGDTNCGGSASRSVTVNFTQTGSLVYGVLSARGATGATLSASSGLVETWNQLQPTPDKMVGAAAYVPDNDNRTITWSVANCYNTAAAIAAIKRLSAN